MPGEVVRGGACRLDSVCAADAAELGSDAVATRPFAALTGVTGAWVDVDTIGEKGATFVDFSTTTSVLIRRPPLILLGGPRSLPDGWEDCASDDDEEGCALALMPSGPVAAVVVVVVVEAGGARAGAIIRRSVLCI